MSEHSTVFIVDNDRAYAESLAVLIDSMGYLTKVFASADDFLRELDPGAPGCLMLDVRMPWTSGLALQEHLAELPLAPRF